MKYRTLLAGPLVVLLTTTASAQETTQEIARRDMIIQAEAASDAGDHTRALDLATRAGHVRMTTSLRLLLAREHNALGHFLDALEFASRCAREADATPSLNNRERILVACNGLVASVRTRVGTITLRVPAPVSTGLRIYVAGGEVNAALWGVDYPVLPGAVIIDATAPSYAPFHREVRVAAGGAEEVTITLSHGDGGQSNQGGRSSGGPGAWPWLVAGAGAMSLGAAVAFWQLRDGAVEDRDAACPPSGQCQAVSIEHNDRARTWNTLTNVALGVGAAAVVGGVTWYLVARAKGERSPRTAMTVGIAPVEGGVMLGLGGVL